MRTRLFLTAGMLGVLLGYAGLPTPAAQADEPERFVAPKMAVHNGDGARQNRESHARDNRRNGNHNGDSSRRGNRHRDNQNHQFRNRDRDDNARNHRRYNNNRNYSTHNNNNRYDRRYDRRHERREARRHERNERRYERHERREARRAHRRHERHERREARNYYRDNYYYGRHNHSTFSFNLGYGSYGYGNRYGYPYYSGYDLYPWWYGDRYGYRSRTGYRTGYGHRGHSNIYCTDPYHRSYGTNWGRNYSDQFAYSSYTDGTYGGIDVRDCHRETHRGVFGRRAAIISSMICYDNDSGEYYETGAHTLVRYIY